MANVKAPSEILRALFRYLKIARRAKSLKEYWGVKNGNNQYSRVGQNVQPKNLNFALSPFWGVASLPKLSL